MRDGDDEALHQQPHRAHDQPSATGRQADRERGDRGELGPTTIAPTTRIEESVTTATAAIVTAR